MKIQLGIGRLTADKVAEICNGTLYATACEDNVLFESVCTDSREADRASLFVAIKGERVDGVAFASDAVKRGCRCVVAEKLPLDVKGVAIVIVQDSVRAIRLIAEYIRSEIDIPTVAITGSVGKTTTKNLVSAVLERKYSLHKTAGNYNSIIGMPMTLLGLRRDNEGAVYELGMSSLGEIQYMSEVARPDIAVITNIGSSHLESLGSRENICRAKMEIVAGLKEGGTLFLNGDEPLLQDHSSEKYQTVYFGMQNEQVDVFAYNIRPFGQGSVFDIRTSGATYKNITINVMGNHNIYNAMVAFAIGLKMEIKEADIRDALLSYSPSNMRQHMYKLGTVTVIEDCYNASPESTSAALEVLSSVVQRRGGKKIALLGDMKELGISSPQLHSLIGERVVNLKADILFTYGSEAKDIAKGAINRGMNEEKIFSSESKDDIAKQLLQILKPNDVLLVKGSRAMKMEEILEMIKPSLIERGVVENKKKKEAVVRHVQKAYKARLQPD